MAQYPNKEDRNEIIHLWKMIFKDTDAFLIPYFNNLYKEENTVIEKIDDKVVATLQIIPCTFSTSTKKISTAYLFAVMTDVEHRKQGIMSNLLHFTFSILKQRHIALTILIPQEPYLFSVYHKFGFQSAFYTTEKCISTIEQDKYIPNNIKIYPALKDATVFYLKKKMETIGILINEKHFQTIYENLKNEHQYIAAIEEDEEIKALALAVKSGETLRFLDIVANNAAYQKQLTDSLATITQTRKGIFRIPDMHGEALGMAYIINPNLIKISELYTANMALMMDE